MYFTQQYGFVLLPVSFLEGIESLFLDQLSIYIRSPGLKHLQKSEWVHQLRASQSE